MRNLIRLLCWLAFTVVFAQSASHEATAQARYRYAFLVAESATEAQIGLVDAANVNGLPEFRELPLPHDWRPPVVRNVSPSGSWAVFISALQSDASTEIRHIRLYNFTTGETRDLEAGYLLNTLNAPEQSIAWSSDNRYVALNLTQDRLQHDVIVHSLEDGNTINLTNDAADQRGVAWSSDSTRIATFTTLCPSLENCSQAVEIIDIAGRERQLAPNMREVAPNTLGLGCRLNWSPNGSHVSFMAGCDQSPSIEREVFTYNIAQNTLEQITSFTSEVFEPGRFQFSQAQYTMAWLDSASLLIGATYQTDPNGQPMTQSLMYELSDGRLIPILDQYAEQWAINPVTNQIAARLINPPQPANLQSADARIDGAVRIFSLQIVNGITPSATVSEESPLPLGCDLTWSPDGSTLAYTTREVNECVGAVQHLLFVDGITQSVQEYTPLLENGDVPYAVVPVGWVAG